MTSAAIAASDRPVDQSTTSPPSLSSRKPTQQYSQSSGCNRDREATEDGAEGEKENIRPQGDGSGGNIPGADNSGKDVRPVEGFDDFGLPIRVHVRHVRSRSDSSDDHEVFHSVGEEVGTGNDGEEESNKEGRPQVAAGKPPPQDGPGEEQPSVAGDGDGAKEPVKGNEESGEAQVLSATPAARGNDPSPQTDPVVSTISKESSNAVEVTRHEDSTKQSNPDDHGTATQTRSSHTRHESIKASEWSHQRLTEDQNSDDEEDEESDGGWRDMPALGELDYYDDCGHLVAKGSREEDNEAVYRGLGGAGKGYTRVQLDEDAQSATSLEEDTSYLFKEAQNNSVGVDEELRDATSQLQATKDLLTESQRIAYVGVTRLAIYAMTSELENMPLTKGARKTIQNAEDSTKKWGQLIMARLYAHMDINPAEQVMIEQLAEHGVQPGDLVPPLMQNARIKNPLAEDANTPRKSTTSSATSPSLKDGRNSASTEADKSSGRTSPPPYEADEGGYVPEVYTQSELPTSKNIDIDLRWTVLCDLFLLLIADSIYDARSRTLLERVGEAMDVSSMQICRFEKRIIDALEMQEAASKETWDESEHMEKRRKMALKKKYMIMGLATVGGGIVIGLSAGLMAPVIGAGLAAGFTTIGISGTGAFLGGVGGTALIASSATLTGSTIGLRASHRRTGAVRTFEYRPLHNNKRVNLIVTVSGWMAGGLDDVRLPYSTVDPILGDIYSVLWEPEMLQSMGDTINILATEALTQGLQQVLGSTILVALMASLQLPIVLTKLSYLIDNPWNVSLTRANAAGLILADSLIDQNLGKRPITLLGFSLGSRVIFSCLKELADKRAYGLVQNVYLFGSPIVANKDDYLKARSVVSGRFVNGYSTNDWILGYLFRATSGGIMRVAGLAPVEGIPRLENIDCTKLVNGHMDYRAAMPRLLREVGWEVLSDEFEEIEDPDPENHAERQRELIREIDAARKEAELKPEKRRFGLFKRGKLAEKKGWETYDVNRNNSTPSSRDSGDSNNQAGTVLFDIDAIRAELASEKIEIKQLESTLPPMKLDFNSPSSPSNNNSKQEKTIEAVSPVHQKPDLSGNKYNSLHDPHVPTSTASRDEEVHMTFDTSFEPPQRSYSSSLMQRTPDPFPDTKPVRPALLSSLSTPATVGVGVGAVAATTLGAVALERNAWADEGEEDEIQMTFE